VQPVIAPRGFRDVYLEAGKSANVTFDIGADELSIVNAEMKRVVEPGTVGNSDWSKFRRYRECSADHSSVTPGTGQR
jgi:hypothetical protein